LVENTIYRWTAEYSSTKGLDAKRLCECEDQNLELNRLPADAELVKMALKELVEGL